jgi:hypothetical protein
MFWFCARFLANAVPSTDVVANARVALPHSGLRYRDVSQHGGNPWPNALH